LEELGIGVTAYGVLSRGLLAGSRPSGRKDVRGWFPRFRAENLERNQKLIDALRETAAANNATPAQLAIAWVLARGGRIVPVIGARTRRQLEDSLGALRLRLSAEDAARIAEAVPAAAVAGARYDEAQMRALDSER